AMARAERGRAGMLPWWYLIPWVVRRTSYAYVTVTYGTVGEHDRDKVVRRTARSSDTRRHRRQTSPHSPAGGELRPVTPGWVTGALPAAGVERATLANDAVVPIGCGVIGNTRVFGTRVPGSSPGSRAILLSEIYYLSDSWGRSVTTTTGSACRKGSSAREHITSSYRDHPRRRPGQADALGHPQGAAPGVRAQPARTCIGRRRAAGRGPHPGGGRHRCRAGDRPPRGDRAEG